MKISFLIAAHNEEKIIEHALSNLSKLPYDNYEVLIGLDGCTDRTEDIVKKYVKKSKKFKYYKLNFRKGKNEVINWIIKKAKGEIIVIHDADWIFKVKDRNAIKKMISLFENKEIGGIAESIPIEWEEKKMSDGNLGYRMVAYSSYLWFEFQKERYSKSINAELFEITAAKMFMTNIFRKNLFKANFSLADDFERTREILKRGKKIVFSHNPEVKMVAAYESIRVRDIFKQKIRTAMARNQISSSEQIGMTDYYIPVIIYILLHSWKFGITAGFMMMFWVAMTIYATMLAKFKNLSTKEGWMLRVKR